MRLRKLVTKAMSVALAGIMLATTVSVSAEEVTDKQLVSFKATGSAMEQGVELDDIEVIYDHFGGVDMLYTDEDVFNIAVLDENSGIIIDEENSIIQGPTRELQKEVVGYFLGVYLYGLDLERDASDKLVVSSSEELYNYHRDYRVNDEGEYVNNGVHINETEYRLKLTFCSKESGIGNANLGSSIKTAIADEGMTDYDAYMLMFTYLTEDAKEMWSATPFIMSDKIDTTDLKFVVDEETENTPTENESYEVVLPTESTSVSATDFAAILTENATKDVVIKSNNNVTFTFAKGTMSAVEGMENYDFGTSIVSDFASAGTMNENVTADNFVTRINYNYSGKLPASASIKIFVGTEYAGKTLYYSKLVESGFTYITSAVADAEGYIVVTQDSCSDYVLTTEKLEEEVTPPADNNTQTPPADNNTQPPATDNNAETPSTNTETPSSPKTGDTSYTVLFVMMLVCGLGIVFIGLKNRKLV